MYNLICVVAFFSFVVLPFAVCGPTSSYESNDIFPKVEKSNGNFCDEYVIYNWRSAFHDCFFDRKYKDGGRELEYIVDRILNHAEICVRNSSQPCQPDYPGFRIIFSKVIEQMKDYSNTYLEEIHHGREKIRDLACVEQTLSLKTYDRCFSKIFTSSKPVKADLQREINRAIRCTNQEHQQDCTEKARKSINHMVRSIFNVQEDTTTTTTTTTTTQAPPAEEVWQWYDYIVQPLKSAWNWFKSLFGW